MPGPVVVALALAGAGLTERVTQAQAQITSPERFFGFQMGADRRLVRWDKAVEYYKLLQKESGGKLKVVTMGPTELGNPFLLVIITTQHDPLTLNKLVNALLAQGIEVLQSPKGFATPDGMAYPAGSFCVPLAQPKMGLIRYLLGETHYMDNEHTRQQDGTPIRPYDMGQDVLAE